MTDIAWLIPAHNDDYALDLCLEALLRAEPLWGVLVLENGSTDQTGAVADWYDKNYAEVHASHETKPFDNAERRNVLMDYAGGKHQHLVFIDSDMVLIENRAQDIVAMAEDEGCATRRLQWTQPCGDLSHIAREVHADRCCHQYVDMQQCPDFEWSETSAGFGMNNYQGGPKSERVLFWHLNLVRPDHRMVQRLYDRGYHTGKLNVPATEMIKDMPADQVHEKALERLRNHWESGKMQPRHPTDKPRMPDTLAEHGGRFRCIFENDEFVDRQDNGWTPPWNRY